MKAGLKATLLLFGNALLLMLFCRVSKKKSWNLRRFYELHFAPATTAGLRQGSHRGETSQPFLQRLSESRSFLIKMSMAIHHINTRPRDT
ncbi:hypothetical protein L596_000251 [Steinernema carpocapsae]|uniref:Uncharacterized protein n=1 Tax=Steinernema carpocapsae TaxID=34508 RepID=A0A4U8UHK3_STECR|nr:hypothetical protein L596_000251 [Steinernema carpocapsae]